MWFSKSTDHTATCVGKRLWLIQSHLSILARCWQQPVGSQTVCMYRGLNLQVTVGDEVRQGDLVELCSRLSNISGRYIYCCWLQIIARRCDSLFNLWFIFGFLYLVNLWFMSKFFIKNKKDLTAVWYTACSHMMCNTLGSLAVLYNNYSFHMTLCSILLFTRLLLVLL